MKTSWNTYRNENYAKILKAGSLRDTLQAESTLTATLL
jgi:hypothetical protein